jgi:uncharacterized Zn finger protein
MAETAHWCPGCGGELSMAYVVIEGHAKDIAAILLNRDYKMTCDHCGHVFQGNETEKTNERPGN